VGSRLWKWTASGAAPYDLRYDESTLVSVTAVVQ
jgi:hypothetical protein